MDEIKISRTRCFYRNYFSSSAKTKTWLKFLFFWNPLKHSSIETFFKHILFVSVENGLILLVHTKCKQIEKLNHAQAVVCGFVGRYKCTLFLALTVKRQNCNRIESNPIHPFLGVGDLQFCLQPLYRITNQMRELPKDHQLSSKSTGNLKKSTYFVNI